MRRASKFSTVNSSNVRSREWPCSLATPALAGMRQNRHVAGTNALLYTSVRFLKASTAVNKLSHIRGWALVLAIATVGMLASGQAPAQEKRKLAPKIAWGTFFGNKGPTYVHDLALDTENNVYLVGETSSSDFPTTEGALQTTLPGGPFTSSGFVAKMDPTATRLLWSTYLGGTEGGGWASSVQVGPDGSVYITGVATNGFPQVDGLQPYGGAGDAFIAKFDSLGGLHFATYLGDSGYDSPSGIVVDAEGAATIVGTIHIQGPGDVFVAKINTAPPSLIYRKVLLAADEDSGQCIALCADRGVVIGGASSSYDFPTVNPIQGFLPYSGIVAKLDAEGGVVFATFLGGTARDSVNGIDVDSDGNIYVTGETHSTDFPLVGSEYDFRGVSDAFVAKLDPTGARLIYSKLIGGDRFDRATAIAVTPEGAAAIAVWTGSHDYPVRRPIRNDQDGDPTDESKTDVAVTLLGVDGLVQHSSYLAGSSTEAPACIAVSLTGAIYVAGWTQSRDFPVTEGVLQPVGRNSNSFVVKISATREPSSK